MRGRVVILSPYGVRGLAIRGGHWRWSSLMQEIKLKYLGGLGPYQRRGAAPKAGLTSDFKLP